MMIDQTGAIKQAVSGKEMTIRSWKQIRRFNECMVAILKHNITEITLRTQTQVCSSSLISFDA